MPAPAGGAGDRGGGDAPSTSAHPPQPFELFVPGRLCLLGEHR